MVATTPTTYEHIVDDDDGAPWIAGANTKVVELAAEVKAYGWSPEELAYQHPHLRLGQVHSALAYYWDHQQSIDADLKRREELAETLRQEAGEHPLAARLGQQGSSDTRKIRHDR